MNFQFANEQDIDDFMKLLDLVEDSFPGLKKESYEKGLYERIDKKEALIAKKSDLLVGALLFSYGNKELLFLAVHPEYQNKGIAQELIKKMTSLFQSGTQISVITFREDDPKGIVPRNLYLNLGFECGELLILFDYPCQKMTLIV